MKLINIRFNKENISTKINKKSLNWAINYLKRKINKLNKKIHRAEDQDANNKVWWRKMKLGKLKNKLNKIK